MANHGQARNKQTNEQIHERNIRPGRDSNQGPRPAKANTTTNELKRILFNSVGRYGI